jgi:hypothetical protein
LTELEFAEVISSSSNTSLRENVATRRTIVYQTLMDPATARIEGEKLKSRLFNRFMFKLNTPEEIEFVSIEKYYEPYIVVSGKHLIDYYRKCAYFVSVDKDAKEVILFGHRFTPAQASFSPLNDNNIRLEGEERIVKENRVFLVLNRYGDDSKLSEFPSAPSEDNPLKLIKSFNMPEVAPDIDLETARQRLVQRPVDIKRIVNEELEIDQRSLIYTPRFRLKYSCLKIAKEAYLEFDGVTLKQIKQREGVLSSAINAVAPIPHILKAGVTRITKKLHR